MSSILTSLARTADSSTTPLLDALRQLQDVGFTPEEAVQLGFGRFPVGGAAYFRDDFGDPRFTPEPHSHKGTDIFAAFDVPVRSPANGVVQYAEEAVGGKAAYVTEGDGTWYYLAHLNGFAPGLSSGSSVGIGQVIGFNGDTGNAKGGAPHVHFEVHPRGGAAVNPKPYLDQWLADALAALPALLEPYRQGSGASRALTNVGLARHLDHGTLTGPARLVRADQFDPVTATRLAESLIDPLTPPVLRRAT